MKKPVCAGRKRAPLPVRVSRRESKDPLTSSKHLPVIILSGPEGSQRRIPSGDGRRGSPSNAATADGSYRREKEPAMPIALSVALFGALAALTRYGVDQLIEGHTFSIFPVSTLAINLSGCVLAGAAVGGLIDRLHEPTWLTVGAVTGFLGA